MATCAVHTSAARAALALAFVLSSRGIHSNGVHIADLLSLNDECVSLLGALADVRAVAAAALVRHG